jgi:hypothetical protein
MELHRNFIPYHVISKSRSRLFPPQKQTHMHEIYFTWKEWFCSRPQWLTLNRNIYYHVVVLCHVSRNIQIFSKLFQDWRKYVCKYGRNVVWTVELDHSFGLTLYGLMATSVTKGTTRKLPQLRLSKHTDMTIHWKRLSTTLCTITCICTIQPFSGGKCTLLNALHIIVYCSATAVAYTAYHRSTVHMTFLVSVHWQFYHGFTFISFYWLSY